MAGIIRSPYDKYLQDIEGLNTQTGDESPSGLYIIYIYYSSDASVSGMLSNLGWHTFETAAMTLVTRYFTKSIMTTLQRPVS